MTAYAVLMCEENKQAIASEHPTFDSSEFDVWLKEHGEGYFLRDSDSALDCHYFEPKVFFEIYQLETGGGGDLFRRVKPR